MTAPVDDNTVVIRSATGTPATTPATSATSATPACTAGLDVPVLAAGAELLGRQPGSGYVVPPALVRRGDGQVVALTPLLFAVLEAVDGERDVAAIARLVTERTGRGLEGEDVCTLLDSRLRPLGLVLMTDGSQPELHRTNPLLALRPRVVVSRPELTRRITAPFTPLFNPVVVTLATVAFAAVGYWVLFAKGLASAAYQAFHQPGLLLAVFAITVVSAGFHEFGHAAALRRGGGTPGAMGAGLYLIWPAFFTDVTDGYRLSRAARIRTDLGGLYFNALVALLMYGIWAATGWDGLLLVIAAQILQMVRQLPPLVRFDGYHLLADVTGVPDLFHRIGPTLRSFLPKRWRHPDSRALRPWVRVVVTLWVLLVVPLLLLTAVLTVIALPRILGTTVHSVAQQWDALTAAASSGAAGSAAVKALAILALVVPVGGIVFMLVRLVRRTVTRTWKRTAGKPVQRALSTLAMLAVLSGVAYAWYPHAGNYRPIAPNERGTITSALGSPTLPFTSTANAAATAPASTPSGRSARGPAGRCRPRPTRPSRWCSTRSPVRDRRGCSRSRSPRRRGPVTTRLSRSPLATEVRRTTWRSPSSGRPATRCSTRTRPTRSRRASSVARSR
jgi:putative peptide zinc metalloprotease protein